MLSVRQHVETQSLVVSSSANVAAIVQDFQKASQSVSLVAPSTPRSGTVAQSATNKRIHRQHGSNVRTQRLMLLQSRLLGRALEMFQQQACGAWTYGFRTYRIRDWDAPVFKHVVEDNIAGLQDFFESGQASLLDRDPSGETLLHVGSSIFGFRSKPVLTITSLPARWRKRRQSSSWCNRGLIRTSETICKPTIRVNLSLLTDYEDASGLLGHVWLSAVGVKTCSRPSKLSWQVWSMPTGRISIATLFGLTPVSSVLPVSYQISCRLYHHLGPHGTWLLALDLHIGHAAPLRIRICFGRFSSASTHF